MEKSPIEANNCRAIALLCHSYKVYELLILNRIVSEVNKKIRKE